SAFCACSGLTSITIPSSVTNIEGDAFMGCTGLTSIDIPNSVTFIGADVFSGCTGLKSVKIGNSLNKISAGVFGSCTGLTNITIPNTVTRIDGGAFANCTGLTSITIPNSVTSIGQQAFRHCTSLTEAKIGNGIKTLSEEAFYDCTKLKNIHWGASVETIGNHAFFRCTSLDTVIIPNTVTTIEGEAFYYCTGIKSLTLPNSLISIGMEAFENCSSLKELIIPNSLTSISYDAFGGTDLRTLTIGNSVEKIQGGAFSTKTGQLNNVFVLRSAPPSCSEGAFYYSNDYGATLHVPVGTRNIYSQTAPWSKFQFIVDDLPNTEAEKETINEVTTRATAGDPMTFNDFKELAETGKHFAIVASSESSLVYPKWFSFATDGYPNILTPAQLFDLENSATGEGWYNIKRVSDNLYVSTEGGNFDAETKMDFKLVNRLAGDYWSEFSDASLHISLDNAEGNHYNANTVNLGFRSGTGGYSTYVAYGPFCVVTVNYLDKNDNPLKESETFIVKEGTTLEAPTIFGKVVQGTYSVVITEDQTINFKYDDSTFDYKVIVNSAIEGMTITIKGDVLSPNQTDYSNNEAVSESDVAVAFSDGAEFISYKVSINGRTITIDCDDARWPINFYKWQTFVRTDRHINGVSFNDQTVDGLYVDYRTTCYQNLTSSRTVTLPAETTVKPSFNVLGQWMHGFVYIDLNNDGDFTDEGELVSYINKDNPNLATDLPNFTTPSTEGTYRMRVKTDWASLDPGGNIGADATNIYSNNHIINNGGAIIDLKLVVVSLLTSINPISCARTGETYYNLEGQRIAEPQHGIVIVRYSDGTSRKMYVR
ncbi:MAG: leucine-rich repeat protein, partial [Bacteroidaceae bacterium]|nr:leucine-rich repeat protein [Bacteroidaceae bacterium]